MSIEGLILGAILTGIVGLWVMSPFARRTTDNTALDDTPATRQRERLTIYYGRVLRNIHDLDEDFSTGKLPQAEYEETRAQWTERGMLALKALDDLDHQQLVTDANADDASIDTAIDRLIESAVQTYKTRQPAD